ncbi:MAG: B12-binding domain-containing radical SAM protein [Desulfobacteraceae bacterium]|nr:B12-binding domain-containing radical SAM protein [Desulfobacteraceae bacterium]
MSLHLVQPARGAPVLFVICPIMRKKKGRLCPTLLDPMKDSPPLGVYSLLARLDALGYECGLLDWLAYSDSSLQDVVEVASGHEVVLLSANSMNWSVALLLAKAIKKANPHTKICVGGPHPTLYPRHVYESRAFDYLFRGEADRYIHLVYENLVGSRGRRIRGFASCSSADIDTVELVNDTDLRALQPLVAYERIPKNKYRVIPVETSRGCRNNCAFCSIPGRKNWRAYPASVVANHIEVADKYTARTRLGTITIIDDCFTADHQRVCDICRLLPEDRFRGRLNWHATVMDLQDVGLIETLAPFTAGLLVGAEVATVDDAKRISKAVTPATIRSAAANLRKYDLGERGIFTFIMGFPWHSTDDCLNIVSFAANLVLDFGVSVVLQWYWAIPGSAIWNTLEKENLVSVSMIDRLGFYRSAEWFYQTRRIGPEGVAATSKKIGALQLCLTLYRGRDVMDRGRDKMVPPIIYAPPMLESLPVY